MGHLSHENEAPGSRNRAIGVPTPDFGNKTSKKQKLKKTKVRPSFLKLRNRFSTMLLRPSFLIYSFLITREGGVLLTEEISQVKR